MRLCTYLCGREYRLGIVEGSKVIDLKLVLEKVHRGLVDEFGGSFPSSMKQFLLMGPKAMETTEKTDDYIKLLLKDPDSVHDLKKEEFVQDLQQTKLGIPIVPSKIVCMGNVYLSHIRQAGREIPDEPDTFLKPPTSLIGPGDPILLPRYCPDTITFGVELCLVIGKRAKHIPEKAAYDYIVGYTILNDVTARGIMSGGDTNKMFDTFAPVGPYIVLRNQIPYPQNLNMLVRVNGDVKQRGCTKDMSFSIFHILSLVSEVMTLDVGDLLATGDIGCNYYLKPGDVMETEIEGLRVLRNPVKLE